MALHKDIDDHRSRSKILIALLAVLVGLNLRPIMASIGPLLGTLQADLTLSSIEASLLTTLPVTMMGLFALAGPRLQRRIGEKSGIATGLLLIALANGARVWVEDSWALITTAILGGIGIAMTQALMPAFLKRAYPHNAGTLMGLFTTGIMAGAAIASALAAPGADIIGWRLTLGFAAMPALIALVAWLLGATGRATDARPVGLPVDNPRAWRLMAFFGIGTGAYTLVLAWLPPYYIELGWSPANAGYLLGALTLTEVLAGLLISVFIHRYPDRRMALVIVILLIIAGLGCLIGAPRELAFAATILLGLGIGALFPLSLIVTLDHADSPAQAGSLLAFVQGGGYLIAAAMPFLAGVLRDELSSLRLAWAGMAVGVAVLLILCQRFSPMRSVTASTPAEF